MNRKLSLLNSALNNSKKKTGLWEIQN